MGIALEPVEEDATWQVNSNAGGQEVVSAGGDNGEDCVGHDDVLANKM